MEQNKNNRRKFDFQEKKILLVEDDETLASLLSSHLEHNNAKVVIEAEGSRALETATREIPDLILLDILLPGMDGFQVLAQVRADSFLKNIPVVVVSNLDSADDFAEADKLGVSDYIVKSTSLLDDIARKSLLALGLPTEEEKGI